MALEEKIVKWSKERLPWQRVILRRIADGEVQSDSDYDKLTNDLIAGTRFEDVEFGLKHLPRSEPDSLPVQLVSVSDPEHVNAIDSDAPLTASPRGLTVVYGDNGSGKSGYARILKHVASARHRENVLSDVFRDTSAAQPTAKLDVTVGDEKKSLPWPMQDMSELRRMRFYDAECGKAYINTDCDFPFQPSALALLEGLIRACTAVRSRIDDKLKANNLKAKSLPNVDEECEDSEPGKFLSKLSGRSSIKKLDALIAGFKEERLEQIRNQMFRLHNADAKPEQNRLSRNVRNLESVAAHIEGLDRLLGTAAVRTLKEKRKTLREAEDAERLAAASFDFDSEPLSDVGSQPWKTLWESARQYSEQHAYAGQSFPVTEGDAHCVLCQQKLEQEAQDRLTRFERFIADDTQAKHNTASTDWQRHVSGIDGLACSPESVVINLTDLENDHATLAKEAKALIQEFDSMRTALLEAVGTDVDLPERQLDANGLLLPLRAAADASRQTAVSLGAPEGIEQRLSEFAKESAELKLLRALKSKRSDIAAEIERLKERESLEVVKGSAATTGISNQVTLLSKDSITEVVRNRFVRESHDLKLERITMGTRTKKGSLVHRPKLEQAKQSVPVPKVFSEGEKTALGLAAFFTEAELDSSKSALIFDDPVNSLDHIRRRRVAKRLTSFAGTRQVIVFTHDRELVRSLKQEALGHSVLVTERSVRKSRVGDEKPGKCEEKHPWNLKDVNDRLEKLQRDLPSMRREQDNEIYLLRVKDWAGRLSQVWERILIQEIRDRVFAEGELEVRPKMLKMLARFEQEDDDVYQGSYWRISGWLRRHEQQSPETPEITDLEKELDLVRSWWKRIKGYQH